MALDISSNAFLPLSQPRVIGAVHRNNPIIPQSSPSQPPTVHATFKGFGMMDEIHLQAMAYFVVGKCLLKWWNMDLLIAARHRRKLSSLRAIQYDYSCR